MLREFKPGIAQLLTVCDVHVVPVFIQGAYAAFAGGKRLPRLRMRIVVRIGPSRTAEQLGLREAASDDIDRAASSLRQCVLRLADQSS